MTTPAAPADVQVPPSIPEPQKPAAPPAEKPAEPPAEKPAAPPAEKPAAPAAEKPAEKPAAPAADKPAEPAAPATYALTLPEGSEEWLDANDVEPLTHLARSLKLDAPTAQLLVDQHVDGLVKQSETFRVQVEQDPEYGGAKLEETLQLSKLALDELRPVGTPRGDALRRLLRRSGYGNNIEIVSLLADLGRERREDRPVGGGAPKRAGEDIAQKLYGATTPK